MRAENQKLFYDYVSRRLTEERQRRSITRSGLSSESGEQYNTIRGIEEGRPFSFHHLVWIRNVLGIDLNELVNYREGDRDKKESSEVGAKNFI